MHWFAGLVGFVGARQDWAVAVIMLVLMVLHIALVWYWTKRVRWWFRQAGKWRRREVRALEHAFEEGYGTV